MSWFWKRRDDTRSASRTPQQVAAPPSAHSPSSPAAVPPIQEMSFGVAPEYWLKVGKAYEAIQAYLNRADGKVIEVWFDYPILMLPEFPAAVEAAGRAEGDADESAAFAALASELRNKQELLRQIPETYAFLADLCGRRLGRDDQGDPRINLHYAVERFAEAAAVFGNNEKGADALVNEAYGRGLLAEMGVQERTNLEGVIQLVRRARAIYGVGTKADDCAKQEMRAHEQLTNLGAEPPPAGGSEGVPATYWLRLARRTGALDAFAGAASREEVKELLSTHAMVLLPELPIALETEADGATDAQVADRLRSLSLELTKFHLRHQDDSNAYAFFMVACANEVAYCKQGEPRTNLRRALEILGQARKLQPEGIVGARGRISEAIARQMLAELGVDTRANLEKALAFCRAAAEFYGPDYALCQTVEAQIRRQLALQPDQLPPAD